MPTKLSDIVSDDGGGLSKTHALRLYNEVAMNNFVRGELLLVVRDPNLFKFQFMGDWRIMPWIGRTVVLQEAAYYSCACRVHAPGNKSEYTWVPFTMVRRISPGTRTAQLPPDAIDIMTRMDR